MTEKIDFVVLWVDGEDPEWQREKARFEPEYETSASSINRYRDWDLMRYWFRGVEKYAPWVNRIFFVTSGQIPEWLKADHPKLRLVEHREYIPKQYLPTFNSNVIELRLHHIADLSEHFVLFNDDMFLTAPVKPEDFFKNGLPCESALMGMATAVDSGECLPHMLINNFAVINRHFNKQEVLRKNAFKFYTLKYGRDLMRNLLLTPFQYFSCFRDCHLPSAYLKDTFFRVWQEEGGLLESCGPNRFRSKEDLTHWLMKSWQICEGNFNARRTGWGHYYELWKDDIDVICSSLERQKYHAVCLNDSKMDIDFDRIKERLQRSFECILPEVSTFERYGKAAGSEK